MKRRWQKREWFLLLTPAIILGLLPIMLALHLSPPEQWNPFALARDRARSKSCQSNLKQMALGLAQYRADYQGRFPLNTAPLGWAGALAIYTKSCPVMTCPADSSVNLMKPPPNCPSSYWINRNLFDSNGVGLRDSDLPQPSHILMLGDGQRYDGTALYALDQNSWPSASGFTQRHLGGANYAWLDGHVGNVRPEAIEAGKLLDACHGNYAFEPACSP